MQSAKPGSSISSVLALNPKHTDNLDGLVNATPMGMKEHPGEAIDLGLISANAWVADIVYFPLETSLLIEARAKGCQIMTGAAMAVHQAAASLNLFTGLTADAVMMRQTFEQIQFERTRRRMDHESA